MDDDDLDRRLHALREPARAPLSAEELEARFEKLRGRKLPVDGNLNADEISRAQEFIQSGDPEVRRDLEIDDAVLNLLSRCEEEGLGLGIGEDDIFGNAFGASHEGYGSANKMGGDATSEGICPSELERLRGLSATDENTRRELAAEDLAHQLLAEAEMRGDSFESQEEVAAPTKDEIAQLLREAEYAKLEGETSNSDSAQDSSDNEKAPPVLPDLQKCAKREDEASAKLPDLQKCAKREDEASNDSAQDASNDNENGPAILPDLQKIKAEVDEASEGRLISNPVSETVSTLVELGLVKEAYNEQIVHCQFLFSKEKGVVDITVLRGAVVEAERLKSLL